jgi:hypothetical protein
VAVLRHSTIALADRHDIIKTDRGSSGMTMQGVLATIGLLVLTGCQTTQWGADVPVQCRVEIATVTTECSVHSDGAVFDCSVVEESAPGCGFAETALESVRKARMASHSREPGSVPKVRFTTKLRGR